MTTIRKRLWTNAKGEEKQSWLVDYRDQAGKRRAKQFSRKKDAEAWQVGAAWQISQGTHTADSQSITVSSAAALWIEKARQEGRERGTLAQYDQLARLHIVPLIGAEKLSKLTRPLVENFRDELVRTRSRAMAGKAVRALSSILNEAMRRGYVAQNVARDVKVMRASRDKPKVTIPSKAELRAILDHAPDDMRPMLMTAIFTGLRSSELRGLKWSDIDFDKGSLSVSQRADKFGNIGAPKSAAGYRTIPLPAALIAELREWKLRCPNGKLGLAFPNKQGGVQQYGHLLRRKFIPLQIAAGVCDPVERKARYGFHALRHAAASAWIKQRIDLKRLQVWIGHESIELTLGTYGHLIADDEGDANLIAAMQTDLLS